MSQSSPTPGSRFSRADSAKPKSSRALGVAQQTAALLPAYRNSPDVAKLASYFGNQFDGMNYTAKDRQKPCFYVAADWDDEIDQMAIIIREQMRLNHKVCIIVPTNRDLYGVAKRLGERGVPVEKATPPRGGAPPADFNSLTPKIATYHSAKGLTFDCVILPKLVENNFQRVQGPRRHRLLLVGITRATQWVYLSTVRGYELKEVALLREAEAKGDLFVLTSAKSATARAATPRRRTSPRRQLPLTPIAAPKSAETHGIAPFCKILVIPQWRREITSSGEYSFSACGVCICGDIHIP